MDTILEFLKHIELMDWEDKRISSGIKIIREESQSNRQRKIAFTSLLRSRPWLREEYKRFKLTQEAIENGFTGQQAEFLLNNFKTHLL